MICGELDLYDSKASTHGVIVLMILVYEESIQDERENKLKSEKEESWMPPPFSYLWR